MIDREIGSQTERQKDRKTDKQGQIYRDVGGQIDKFHNQKNKHLTDRQKIFTEKQTDIKKGDEEIHRQTNDQPLK